MFGVFMVLKWVVHLLWKKGVWASICCVCWNFLLAKNAWRWQNGGV